MIRRTLLVGAAAFALVGCSDDAVNAVAPAAASFAHGGNGSGMANAAASNTYQVTIENLTNGQPFSPGIIATHTKQVDVWEVGSRPSPLIINIAENGLADASLAAAQIAELRSRPGVFNVVMTAPTDDNTPPILPGAPNPPSVRTYTIEAAANANHLSVAVMIICTNDGFTGVSSVRLPGGFNPVTFETVAYDSGTETNTEKYTDIVDPCQLLGPEPGPPALPNGNNNDLPEDGGVIKRHAGIQGVAVNVGLNPSLHNWTAPVARITVQRVK